jgi:hypothetical protein
MLGMNRAIVYNSFKGGVEVCHPAPDIFSIMWYGGFWDEAPEGFVEEQIDRQVRSGIDPAHAKRFAEAVAFGGKTENEVWEILIERDTSRFGDMPEIVHLSDLPPRDFRDAWRRSSNGGPIWIDLNRAKEIQFERIVIAVDAENRARRRRFEISDPIEPDWNHVRDVIAKAKDETELLKIWIDGVPR